MVETVRMRRRRSSCRPSFCPCCACISYVTVHTVPDIVSAVALDNEERNTIFEKEYQLRCFIIEIDFEHTI